MKPTKRIIGMYGGGKRATISTQIRGRRVNMPGVVFGQLAVIRLTGHTDREPIYTITHVASGMRIGEHYVTKMVAVDVAVAIDPLMDYDAHWERVKCGDTSSQGEAAFVRMIIDGLHYGWAEHGVTLRRWQS